MTDNTIIPSPLLDRGRVAEAIARQIRLDIHPIHAKAAVHGMPVALTEEQSLKVADAVLAALVNAHPIDGKAWLIEANRDWQRRNDNDNTRWRGICATQRRLTDSWRGLAVNGYAGVLAAAGAWEWRWPHWVVAVSVVVALGSGVALRMWLLGRDRRKAGGR